MPNLSLKLADGSVARVSNGASQKDVFDHDDVASGGQATAQAQSATVTLTADGGFTDSTATFTRVGDIVHARIARTTSDTATGFSFNLVGLPPFAYDAAKVYQLQTINGFQNNAETLMSLQIQASTASLSVTTTNGSPFGAGVNFNAVPVAAPAEICVSWLV